MHIQLSEDPNDTCRWHGDAKDMPPEAEQHWFEITRVRVMQYAYISEEDIINAGLTEVKIT
ncbi:MAG: hypothetical protein ACRCYP_01525, partial [Alphaproteobacteria bacterium]